MKPTHASLPFSLLVPALLLLLCASGCGDDSTDLGDEAPDGGGTTATGDAGPAPDPCPAGGLGCPCTDAARCDGDLVCDPASSRCRAPLECGDLDCVQQQVCVPPEDGMDAACLEQCEPGFTWDADAGRCRPRSANCQPGEEASILGECTAVDRECLELEGGRAICGGCAAGFVLDAGVCREVVGCDLLFCADRNRECVEGEEGQDARCAECAEGTLQDADGNCIRQSCTLDADGQSLGARCAADNRACQSVEDGAVCGVCLAGYVEVAGNCTRLIDCEAQGCNAQNRRCALSALGQASCGACRAGFVSVAGLCTLDAGATCDPDPATGSILGACQDEHRSCQVDRCGDCETGYYWDAALGQCSESVDCSECADADRQCVSENGANRCGECIAGHVVDAVSGACRPVLQCADIECASGDLCVAATDDADASCRTDCGERALFNGGVCVPCPVCAPTDALGRDTHERGIDTRPTAEGQCICQTDEGYFYSLGGEVGTFPCDADGDGWVRQSARVAFNVGDPVLTDNARCTVRTIERVVLQNERGDSIAIPLDDPLPMYESDRNDDDVLLDVVWDRLNLPEYFDPDYSDAAGAACAGDGECAQGERCRGGHCTAAPRLRASALNALTKYCHALLTDYNDNGVADADEWGDRPTDRGVERATLNRFSYFAELHSGRFEPDSPGGSSGSYVITERARAAGSGASHVALTYTEGSPAAEWRQCVVRRDAQFQDFARPAGMDFASIEPNPEAFLLDDADPMWRGMVHHSQFKCLVLTAEPDEEAPHEQTVADASGASYDLNSCRLLGLEAAPDLNPSDATFSCEPLVTTPAAGEVYWAAVRYGDYPSTDSLDGYVRGCVNGCAEARLRAGARLDDVASWDCPTFDYGAQNAAGNLACTRDIFDFGKLVCLEACGDGIDNDSDLITDEGIYVDLVSGDPLMQGDACDTTLLGVCAAGTVGCETRPGGALTCLPDDAPADADLCDGLDEDCDEAIDEDALDPEPGFTPTVPSGDLKVGDQCLDLTQDGICQEGAYYCRDTGAATRGLVCETIRPVGEDESCNGLDDDCDGPTDEAADLPPPFGQPCTVTDAGGTPLNGLCAEGETRCTGGQEVCTQLNSPVTEQSSVDFALCDSDDNDCDGQVDEADTCEGVGTYRVFLVPGVATSGDAEFGGNGPDVTVTVQHTISNGAIDVEICATFVETAGDTSTGEACETVTVEADGGARTVNNVLSSAVDVEYVDDGHAIDVLRNLAMPDDETTENMVSSSFGDTFLVVCGGDTPGDDLIPDDTSTTSDSFSFCDVRGNVRYTVAPQ